MIIVQDTANTIVSASFFSIASGRDVGGRDRQRFWIITSIARTSAARVKSTVRFRGREACQYVIPTNELAKLARKVVVSLDNRGPTPARITFSNAFLPPSIITRLNPDNR